MSVLELPIVFGRRSPPIMRKSCFELYNKSQVLVRYRYYKPTYNPSIIADMFKALILFTMLLAASARTLDTRQYCGAENANCVGITCCTGLHCQYIRDDQYV